MGGKSNLLTLPFLDDPRQVALGSGLTIDKTAVFGGFAGSKERLVG
jgi:hypothetical protein